MKAIPSKSAGVNSDQTGLDTMPSIKDTLVNKWTVSSTGLWALGGKHLVYNTQNKNQPNKQKDTKKYAQYHSRYLTQSFNSHESLFIYILPPLKSLLVGELRRSTWQKEPTRFLIFRAHGTCVALDHLKTWMQTWRWMQVQVPCPSQSFLYSPFLSLRYLDSHSPCCHGRWWVVGLTDNKLGSLLGEGGRRVGGHMPWISPFLSFHLIENRNKKSFPNAILAVSGVQA